MPVLDLFCAVCEKELPSTYLPLYTLPEPRVQHGYVVTQDFDRPLCCGQPMQNYVPNVAMDAYEPFKEFTVEEEIRGEVRRIKVDSLSALRKVERESEQRHANGEGRPLRWRAYSQNDSNGDVNTFGPDPSQTPSRAAVKKFAKGIRRSAVEPTAELGPGVTDSSASPLGG